MPKTDVGANQAVVTAAADAIAAELIAQTPQTLKVLCQQTNFRRAILLEALRESRFRKVTGGYALAPLKR